MQSRSMITDRGRLRKTIAKPLEFRKDLELGGLYKDIIHQIKFFVDVVVKILQKRQSIDVVYGI